jgi:hypothetical protein
MENLLRYMTYLANGALIVVACFISAHSYGRDSFVALLLLFPPALSLTALCLGPDLEERRLRRQVSKARLRKELQDLEKKAA